MRPIVLLLLAVVFSAGCDAAGPGAFEPEYVVEAYFEVGAPLEAVRLSRTAPVGGTYDADVLGVRGARVEVQLLADDGTVEAVYPYEGRFDAGLYRSAVSSVAVLAGRRYVLDVVTEDGETIRAETLTPGHVELVEASADTVYYQTDEQLRVTLRRTDYAGGQNVFMFTTAALDARVEQLVPFYRRLYDQGDLVIDDVRISGSPLLNERNYDLGSDGTIEITLPWLAVAFYGRNRISVSAVDANLYDFIRSQQAQAGASTLAPGEIPNVLERVDGGTGVFGSYARTSHIVYVERAEQAPGG